jgi:hypothetical protein
MIFAFTARTLRSYCQPWTRFWKELSLRISNCILGKSHLAVEEVDYLGHTIFKGGVKVSKKQSKAVRALLPPRTLNELQNLTGVLQYFRTFIPNFSKIARPLTVMLLPAEPLFGPPLVKTGLKP